MDTDDRRLFHFILDVPTSALYPEVDHFADDANANAVVILGPKPKRERPHRRISEGCWKSQRPRDPR